MLVDNYEGVDIHFVTLTDDVKRLAPGKKYIVKVDQGVKKRGKQGLIRLNVTKASAKSAVMELAEKGFDTFIAEPMIEHEDNEEAYLSLERTRKGITILYSSKGGIDIEDHQETITQYDSIKNVPIKQDFLERIITMMDREHFSFVEINPLIQRGEEVILLDAAVLADSAGMWQSQWGEFDIAETRVKNHAEQVIGGLNDGSPASFSFRVLNPDGAIWLLLSGGGASITIADEAANQDKVSLIGNYGEYSGGPTQEETKLYTEAVLEQLLESRAPRKAIILAGGVANFTDIKKTFAGVIDALTVHVDALRESGIVVFVRRGGPNESEGLKIMEEFLKKHKIYGSVHGSDKILTTVIDEALEYVDA